MHITTNPHLNNRPRRARAAVDSYQTHLLDCNSAYTLQDNEAFIEGKVFVRDSFGGYIPKEKVLARTKIRVPADALPELSKIRLAEQEHVMVILLDGNNSVIDSTVVTVGLVNQSQVHPRETFRYAIALNAVSIIVAHNHPSGNTEPSEADLIATRRLVDAGKLLGISVLDHVIVTANTFKSIRESHPAYFG